MADGHIESYIDGLGYPANKDELVNTLKQNNAPSWMVDNVNRMPAGSSFSSYSDVGTTYDQFDPIAA